MNGIKIDKGVPMPDSRSSGTGLYPFEGMEVGDSFFTPGKTRQQMDNACGHWRKKNNWRFTLQYREEDEADHNGEISKVSGTRVWRKE
jgi:hypothetical protein